MNAETITTLGRAAAAPIGDAPDGPARDEVPPERAWAASFLAPSAEGAGADEARRFVVALGLSAVYGVALGLRGGARLMLIEALAIPAASLAVAALGVPALAILLALADAPVRAPELLDAAARGAARVGLILLGLAPPVALFAVTTEDAGSAVLLGGVGLGVAWAFGLRAFSREVLARSGASRARATLATIGFALFATALAGRVWLAALGALWGLS